MLKFIRLLVALAALGASVACAQDAAKVNENLIKKAFKERFPDVTVESVTKTRYGGLYEVYVVSEEGNAIFYTDDKVGFVIVRGQIVDTQSMQNVTRERFDELRKVDFAKLPFNLAMKEVRGSGKRQVAYFADPNCRYCKQLERDLSKVQDVTIYTFIFPILSEDSVTKSTAVWCAADRVKAWNEMMFKGVTPKSAACETPFEKIHDLAARNGIRSTPTLIFADNRVVPGAIPLDELEKRLNGGAAKAK